MSCSLRADPMRYCLRVALILLLPAYAYAQETSFAIPDRAKVDGLPPIPMSIVDAVAPYGQFRQARLLGWHPTERRLLISTAFGNVTQVHEVRSSRWGAHAADVLPRRGHRRCVVRARRPPCRLPEGHVRRRRSHAALPLRPRLGPHHAPDRRQVAPRRSGLVPSSRAGCLLLDAPQRQGPRPVGDGPARAGERADDRGSRRHVGRARLVGQRQGSPRAAAHRGIDRDAPVAHRRRVRTAGARDAEGRQSGAVVDPQPLAHSSAPMDGRSTR